MTRAIRKHAGDVAAILAMTAVAIGVAAYILFNQDARPNIPLIEDKPVKMEAEFADAQAVVPGQGQSVRVSGVQVGKIGNVELEDGLAIVTLNIDQKYADMVRQDATALLRPRTGLKDMFVELDPGSTEEPPLGENGRIPAQNTAPDIDPDEILSALDTDTRAYLQLLVNGAGKGLRNNGEGLRDVFKRLEPLHRDLAKVNGAFASRREALASLIHNYGELTTELAKSPEDLERLVTASNDVFEAFASVDQDISETVSELPSALNQTSTTLTKVDRLGEVLGPTLDDLRPAFRQLDVANREVLPLAREGEPILRNEIRPFVRTARPYVRDLRPAAADLARATPELTTSFGELNRFFNLLAFNPAPGEQNAKRPRSAAEPLTGNLNADRNRDEGYLFWLHWVTTNGVSLFSVSDAQGPFRRSLLQLNAESICGLAEEIALAFETRLPEPLKPLADEATKGFLTTVLGQNPFDIISCEGLTGGKSKSKASGGGAELSPETEEALGKAVEEADPTEFLPGAGQGDGPTGAKPGDVSGSDSPSVPSPTDDPEGEE